MIRAMEHMLEKEKYPLIMEKIAQKTRIPFWKGILILSGLYIGLGWIFLFSTHLINGFSQYDIYYTFMWNWPGAATIITTVYFSKRLRNKTLDCFEKVLPFIKEDKRSSLEGRIRKTFTDKRSLVLPLVFSFILAMPFQLNSLVLNPTEPLWIKIYQFSHYETTFYGIGISFASWFWAFFILSLGYFSLGVAYSIYKIKDDIGKLEIEDVDIGVLRPLGSLVMTLASSFLLGTIVNLALFFIAPSSIGQSQSWRCFPSAFYSCSSSPSTTFTC
jgi:hypothetical protein